MHFIHDSWDTFYKDPFGALPTGTETTFRVRSEDTVNIKLHTNFLGKDRFYPMINVPGTDTFEVTLKMPETPGLLWYDFHFDAFNSHYVYGTQPDGIGGEGQVNLFNDNSYQITVYDAERVVPDWYKEGLMYQIFPDRFYKGEREDFTPVYPHHSVIHSHWSDTPHYFRKPNGDIEYWDFSGGNLLGVIEKLDYLKDLGVSIIYLNPIFESTSNHKYDTADYMKIAPEFGNEKIFIELCEEAKKRGIRIILDGVFNHTGDDSRYFNRYGTYPDRGAYQDVKSPYHDWYNFREFPNNYESWWGISSMPSMNKQNREYQNFIYNSDNSVVRTWLKNGASGWRLDVADELTDDFIVGIKEAMLEEKADSVLIGEVWEDASNKIAYGKHRDYFLGHELDSVMNYPFRTAMLDFFNYQADSGLTHRRLMSLYEHYPKENFMSNMNLIDSHDRRRALTEMGNVGNTDGLSEADREKFQMSEMQRKVAREKLKLLVLVQMTYPGVPTIYYGDETGMEGLNDPYNRAPLDWENIDTEILDWYKKMTALRNNSTTLKRGDYHPVYTDDDIFAFTRTTDDESLLIAVNRSETAEKRFAYRKKGRGKDIFSGEEVELDHITLEPFGYRVIRLPKDKPKEKNK